MRQKHMSRCMSCGVTVGWGRTVTGSPVSLDPETIPYREAAGGSLRILRADGKIVNAVRDASSPTKGQRIHVCPDAEDTEKQEQLTAYAYQLTKQAQPARPTRKPARKKKARITPERAAELRAQMNTQPEPIPQFDGD